MGIGLLQLVVDLGKLFEQIEGNPGEPAYHHVPGHQKTDVVSDGSDQLHDGVAGVCFDFGVEFPDRTFPSLQNLQHAVSIDNQEAGDVTEMVRLDRLAFDVVKVLIAEGAGGTAEVDEPKDGVILPFLDGFPKEIGS